MISLKVCGTVCLLVILAGIFGIGGVRKQKPSPTNAQPAAFDENRIPIADFSTPEPSDAVERAKLRARTQKHNKSDWAIIPEGASDTTVKVDFVNPNLPAFPFGQSNAVIVGKIRNARAYLSEDKTGIFSTFEISIEEILKNSSQAPLSIGSLIEGEREGGRVRFPSGRLHLYLIKEQNMPRLNCRYVLFLKGGDSGPIFEIITAYELSGDRVHALDDLVQPRRYEDAEVVTFLSELRSKVSNP